MRLGADYEAVGAIGTGIAAAGTYPDQRKATEKCIEGSHRTKVSAPTALRNKKIVHEDGNDDGNARAETEKQFPG